MPTLVHYIPIVTTLLAVPFSLEIFRRWRVHPDRLHLLWWAIGVAVYGVGTFTEAWTSLFGWNPSSSSRGTSPARCWAARRLRKGRSTCC